ncbi:MAG: glycosyltransferase family 1 protein [Planctomycetota bacterium]|nr:glycosyltransferase family 1 protein [Planctomycetota bacterium]
MSGRRPLALDVRSLNQPFSSYARVIRLMRAALDAVDLPYAEWKSGECNAEVLWTPGPSLPEATDQPRFLITIQDINPMLPDGRSWFARFRRSRRYRRLVNDIDQLAWRISVPSSATAQKLQEHFPRLQSPMVSIPWYPSAEFGLGGHAGSPELRESGYLLYVGALRPHKNWRVVLHTYAGLTEELKQQHALVMVGRGHRSGKEAHQLAEQLGIASRVRWMEGLADEDLPALYRGAAAFLFPSLLEGFGLPPLEAQACGTPVIAAATSSLPEVLGSSTKLLDPHDVAAWTAATTELLNNQSIRETAVQAGLANVQRFSPLNTGQALLKALEV